MGLLNDDDEELPAWARGPLAAPLTPKAKATNDWLARDPNAEYGMLLPIARGGEKGPDLRFAMPEILRSLIQGPAQIGMAAGGEGPVPVNAGQTIMNVGPTAAAVARPPPGSFGSFGAPGVRGATSGLLEEPIPRLAGETRISTRNPTGVKATDNPLTQHLAIGEPEVVASSKAGELTELMKRYPGFKAAGRVSDPAERARRYVDRSADNLNFIMDNVPRAIREEAPHWYDSANQFNRTIAKRYDLPETSVHGATAALSPQKDWYQNASLTERTADTIFNKSGVPMTPEMKAKMGQLDVYQKPRYADDVKDITGARLHDLEDPLQQAMWLRLYDETHNSRNFRTMSPTGLLGDFVRSKSGEPSKVAWGSFAEIGKAIQSLKSGGNTDTISGLLGERHKVRNFYNNMAVPGEKRFGDVTADTHAVAANQMRPLSGNTEAVSHNFGNSLPVELQPPGYMKASGSKVSGVQGTYGLNAEPYRKIADERGLLPRAAQSITWEGVRGLFPDTFKTAGNMQRVDAIWKAADRGTITAAEARRRIVELAGGFKEPDWAMPRGLLAGPKPSSTYR